MQKFQEKLQAAFDIEKSQVIKGREIDGSRESVLATVAPRESAA